MSPATPTRRLQNRGSLNSQPRAATVCVVDRNPADYAPWQHAAGGLGIELVVLNSVAAALRQARTSAVDLWIVNTELPGMSGAELCGLLRDRSASTPVCLVCDEYSPEVERTAWAARATVFCCKSAHQEWLTEWAVRRGLRQPNAPQRFHESVS